MISGVARSINFYPLAPEKPSDGIANIAFGLGKYIVDGGNGIRFSPKYPKKILQLSSPEMALSDTHKFFFALDLRPESFSPDTDDTVNLMKLRIRDAEDDHALKMVASTYDYDSNQVKDGILSDGKRIVTFSPQLNHGTFPLAAILQQVLEIGQREMNKPVEIEFAVNLDMPKGQPKVFSLLQIRPIAGRDESINLKPGEVRREETLLISETALGNGIIKGIHDFVYVRPEMFDSLKSEEIVVRLDKLNERFLVEKKNYVLVGPGRWGSNDPSRGIPVKWPQISAARVIVESGLDHYRIDPSQGTHFFQNLTSFRVGYFTINPFINDGFYDIEFLNNQPAFFEDEYIRHVRFESPIRIEIDGKKNFGVVYKP